MALEKQDSFFSGEIQHDLHGLGRLQKFELLRKFWPNSDLQPRDLNEKDYETFFNYLGAELGGLRSYREDFAAQTFETTTCLISVLFVNRNKMRKDILPLIQPLFLNTEEAAVSRSIDLTLRLWLTINVHSLETAVGPVHANDTVVEWEGNESLDDFLSRQFKKANDYVGDKKNKPRIDPALTAAHLVNNCGVKIDWTDNVLDHLKLDLKRRTITIYRHKICLVNHAKAQNSAVLPLELLEETIDTLNLLFPFGLMETRAILGREGQPFYGLGNCGREMQYDMDKYQYWGKRLKDICNLFDEPPRHWRQLLSDRRNMMDWATFWIGLLVLVLTIVSIVFGTVSTVYAIKQYELALAQACLMQDADRLLPQFCH